MRTLEETIGIMKVQILEDVRDCLVPIDVASFSELHDFVDANEYGDFCDDAVCDERIKHFGGRDEHEGMPQALLDFMNEAQDTVGLWLSSGKMRKEFAEGTIHPSAAAETIRKYEKSRRALEAARSAARNRPTTPNP